MYIETNLSGLQAFVAGVVVFLGIGLALSRQNRVSLVRIRLRVQKRKEQSDVEQAESRG